MKKYLLNQRGSALLLAVAVVLIFTILGLSLMTLSTSGLNKNEVREDKVQAQKLSEMGLDYVTKEIYYTLQNKLDAVNGLPVRLFVPFLEDTLNGYLCFNSPTTNVQDTIEKIKAGNLTPNFRQVSSITGLGEYCILTYQDSILENRKTTNLKKDVTFLSLGTSGSRDSMLTSIAEIGTDAVPDHLNYAIGTNITSENPKDGEGNLLIHGGVEIKGDLKVEGNLITREYAYGGGQWVDSVLPRILPYSENTQANIVLSGSAYKLTSNVNYDTHLKNDSFPSKSYSKKTNTKGEPELKDLFHEGYVPKAVKRTPVKTPIDIESEKENYMFYKNTSGVTNKIASTTTLSNQNFINQKVFYTHEYQEKYCNKSYCNKESDYRYRTVSNDSANYILSGTNRYNALSILGNLTLSSNNSSLTIQKDSSEEGGTLYVGEKLTIGNMSTNDLSDKPDISINGAIYVNGDLVIQGADLTANALIYVDGNVTIKYSSIKGLNLGNNQIGSLVIFATGNIDISNNSVDKDPDDPNGPSMITGFFYSEKNFELYGVGSNMIINGGVSANRIVLNGIRGRSSVGKYNSQLKKYTSGNNVYYWEHSYNQNSRNARLKIQYNPDIITTFSDLRQKEHIITYVNPSTIKDLEFK